MCDEGVCILVKGEPTGFELNTITFEGCTANTGAALAILTTSENKNLIAKDSDLWKNVKDITANDELNVAQCNVDEVSWVIDVK